MLYTFLLAALVAAASGWTVPMAACSVRGAAAGVGLPSRFAAARMQETEAPVSDFTEDLLDALTTEETTDEPAQVYKGADGIELDPLPSYVNMQSVEELRSKYALHDNDTGSSQVQIAVLTARIAYMTKHMQENKKDYASLRGLTAMVTRRRKLLEYLLREDLPEFKRLTSELGIRTNQLLKPKLGGARGSRV